MKRSVFIFALLSLMFSCEKGTVMQSYDSSDITTDFVLNNSIILSPGDCAGDPGTRTYICFESVLNDSRCPEGVVCIWAGNAAVRFKFSDSGKEPQYFNLNTLSSFANDTTIDGYKFTLIALHPYPVINKPILPGGYKAEIKIEKAVK